MATAIFYSTPGKPRCSLISVELESTTVNDLKQTIVTGNPDVYLTHNGRVLEEDKTLLETGVHTGSVIRCEPRLKGGALLKLKIMSRFGCVCCNNHCTYDCCRKGRVYDVRVSSIQDVSTIFEAVAQQNNLWSKKKPKPVIFTKANVVLEPDRKILFYDLQDGDELVMYLSPILWFTSEFRKGGRTKDEDEEEAELQRRIEAKKAAMEKGITPEPGKTDTPADVDVEAMAA